MDLDDLTRSDFGQGTLDELASSAFEAGVDRMLVDLGLERDKARRFAIWSLLYMLEAAPAVEITFQNVADRDAAQNFMQLIEVEEGGLDKLEATSRDSLSTVDDAMSALRSHVRKRPNFSRNKIVDERPVSSCWKGALNDDLWVLPPEWLSEKKSKKHARQLAKGLRRYRVIGADRDRAFVQRVFRSLS